MSAAKNCRDDFNSGDVIMDAMIFGDMSTMEELWKAPFYFAFYILLHFILPLAVCAVCGAICSKQMKKKGYRNPEAWFACGFFLVFLGVIICLVMPKRKTENTELPPEQPQSIRCQGCGMINAPGTKFCSGCGNKLN